MILVIENNIVRGCTDNDVLRIEIPEGIVAVSDNAFSNLKKLHEVVLPKSAVKIGEAAFSGCVSLRQINIENVRTIGESAFSGCSSLSDIKFGSDVGYLCNFTFNGCSLLEEVKLPENIRYIGCGCFSDCSSLSAIEMPGVMEIDWNAFERCTNLYSLDLPSTLIHIAPSAFSGCTNLQSVTVRSRFVDMDETAFINVSPIIKAVRYSTAYNYALSYGFSFCPTIIDDDYFVIRKDQLKILSDSGILFYARPYEDNKMIIFFDKSAADQVHNLIGENNES